MKKIVDLWNQVNSEVQRIRDLALATERLALEATLWIPNEAKVELDLGVVRILSDNLVLRPEALCYVLRGSNLTESEAFAYFTVGNVRVFIHRESK